jgi:hypothetical protein
MTNPTPLAVQARELSAKLIPHTTSVHNVELIQQALTAQWNAGRLSGLRDMHERPVESIDELIELERSLIPSDGGMP